MWSGLCCKPAGMHGRCRQLTSSDKSLLLASVDEEEESVSEPLPLPSDPDCDADESSASVLPVLLVADVALLRRLVDFPAPDSRLLRLGDVSFGEGFASASESESESLPAAVGTVDGGGMNSSSDDEPPSRPTPSLPLSESESPPNVVAKPAVLPCTDDAGVSDKSNPTDLPTL